MSGFSKDWLSLREAADDRARNASLLTHLNMGENGVRVIDLGTGTGSNLRYLAPRLDASQHWTLVDADGALLQNIAVPKLNEKLSVETLQLDLMRGLDQMDINACHLVTASAFFDLVSEEWVTQLASKCARANIPNGLFVLSVDGEISWAPEDPFDRELVSLFNAHMCRDKGFGPALGGKAPEILEKCFAAVGYRVWSEDSCWLLGAESAELQLQLLEGYANAASEQDSSKSNLIEEWKGRRRAALERGQSTLVVGHRDIAVRLP